MKVKVTKLSKNENSFRTPLDQIDSMPYKPEVGHHLLLKSSTHDSGGISTSLVEEIEEKEWGYVVKTLYSVYEIRGEEGNI